LGFRVFSLIILLVLAFVRAPAFAESRPQIVVLYAGIGEGHRSAAKAIKADVERKYPGADVDLKDMFEFLTPAQKEAQKRGYDFMTKYTPGVYDWFFRSIMFAGKEKERIPTLFTGDAWHEEDVGKYLAEKKPAVVVSTFNHATEVLIRLREKGKLDGVPIAWQHTDYVPEMYFVNLSKYIDMTFLPHDSLREYWIRKGVAPENAITTGMPVNALAWKAQSPEERAAFLRSKGLDPNIPIVSLMGGSAGVGNFAAQVRSIVREVKGPLQIVVMAGHNERQIAKLQAMTAPGYLPPGVTVMPLGRQEQEDVFNYLRASSVFVTKSGGLTPTEAAVIGVPMVLLDINGGQERYNANLFGRVRLALVNAWQRRVGREVARVMNEPRLRETMLGRYAEFRKMMRTGDISDWVLSAAKVTDPATGKAWAGPPTAWVDCNKAWARQGRRR
jgi:UDP-N-acetylglucosamine:LPS N-acetylglucosamine transferase